MSTMETTSASEATDTNKVFEHFQNTELVEWIQATFSDHPLSIDGPHIANGAFLCALVARQGVPPGEDVPPEGKINLYSAATDEATREVNMQRFKKSFAQLLERSGTSVEEQNATLRLMELSAKRNGAEDTEKLVQLVKEYANGSHREEIAAAHNSTDAEPHTSSIPRILKPTGIAIPKSISMIPRFTRQPIGRDDQQQQEIPSTPERSLTSSRQIVPGSAGNTASVIVSAAQSTSNNNTPSKLPRLRAKKWAGQEIGRKRLLDHASSGIQAPKRRAIGSLFGLDTTLKKHGSEMSEDDHHHDFMDENLSQDTTSSTADTLVSISTTSSNKSSIISVKKNENVFMDTEVRLQQEIKVAKCLKDDLIRDNVRMRLKIDTLREDIDCYYEVLTRIEQSSFKYQELAQQLAEQGENDKASSILALTEGVQRIISAPKPRPEQIEEVGAALVDVSASKETETVKVAAADLANQFTGTEVSLLSSS